MTAASAVPATAPPKGASPSKGAPEGADGDFAATLTDISTARTATAEGQTKTSDDHAASGQPQGNDACADDAKDGKTSATPDAQTVVLAGATLTVLAPAPAAPAGKQAADASSTSAGKQAAFASLAAVGQQVATAPAGRQVAPASPANAGEQVASASLAGVGQQVAPAAQKATPAAEQIASAAKATAGQQAASAPAAQQSVPSVPAPAAAAEQVSTQPAAQQQVVAAPQQQPTVPSQPAAAPVATDAAPAVAAPAPQASTTSDDQSAAQQGPQQQAPQVTAPAAAATPAPAPVAAAHTTAAPQAPAQHTPRLALASEHVHALVRIASHRGQAQAHLALKPAELGGVEVRLRVTTQGLVASIRADRPDSAQVLQQAGADLRKAFEAAGVDVASVDIGFAGDGAGSRANERQAENATGSRARNGAAQDDELSPIDPDTTTATTTTIALGALVDVLA